MKYRIESKSREINGFTLIELVIVVLVIFILAALAIPIYRDWTSRAQNGAALADIGHLCVAEAAFLGDFEHYGRTNDINSVAVHGNGIIVVGPSTTGGISGPSGFSPIGLSLGVHLVAHTNAPEGSHFSAMAKHISGTRIFGVDNSYSGFYQRRGPRGQALAATGIILAVTAANDFDGNGWENL